MHFKRFRGFICGTVLAAAISGCTGSDNGDVGTYTGNYRYESVTYQARFGVSGSQSIGRSEDAPVTVTLSEDGRITLSFEYSPSVAYDYTASGRILNLRYSGTTEISARSGLCGNGAFEFDDGNAHVAGTIGDGRASGTIAWSGTASVLYGTVVSTWSATFEAAR